MVFIDVSNVLIITATTANENTPNTFNFITSRFVGRSTDHSQPVHLATFNGLNDTNGDQFVDATFARRLDNLLAINLFPDKLIDLQGRVVRVALFNYKPYSVWEERVSVLIRHLTITSRRAQTIANTVCVSLAATRRG